MSLLEIQYFNASGERCSTTLGEPGWNNTDGIWNNPSLGLSFKLETSSSNEEHSYSVPHDSITESGENTLAALIFTPPYLTGQGGDDARFILPCGIGVSCGFCNKTEGEYILPGFSAPKWPEYVMNMLLAAKVTPQCSSLMIIDDCRFDSGFRLRTNYGDEHVYSIDALFNLRRNVKDRIPADSPTVICRRFPGNLADIAKYYRDYLIEKFNITPLAQKFSASDRLRRSAEALLVRLRMATKPVPSPVEEQTTENQPEVRVLMDFDAAIKVAEECSRQEIPAIDFTFVGWNYGGHDGAFPQIFPVEEKLGGEAAMIKAVNRMKELGYQVGIHDNVVDSYTLADNLDHSDWARSSSGEVVNGEVWGGGRAHLLCPKRALEKYVPEHFAELEKFGLDGTYYVDVISLNNLYPCYEPEHPLSLKEAAGYWKQVLLRQHEFTGVSMSEGTREWALPEVDRAYAATNRPDPHTQVAFADETVPLFPLVFHGLVLYNSCRMTINSMPGDDLYLDNIAFGGLPLLYFYQRFQAETSILNGACDDLTVTSEEKLRDDVARIKHISEDVRKLAPLQSVFIADYDRISQELLCVTYENGTKMYVNYGTEPASSPDGTTVPAKEFVIIPV